MLLAPPADVVVFSHAFANHVGLPARAHAAMRRNLETRLRMRWDDIHIPTLAPRLRVPVLVVHDREDPDVPYGHAEEIVRAWPEARLMTTAGLGHRAILRDPDRPAGGGRVPARGRDCVIVMDRENLYAPGWSHVLSTTNDLAELDAFRERVGAPRQALHLGNRRWPHLDLKLEPRDRALADPEVRVFERTAEMLRFLKDGRRVSSAATSSRAAARDLLERSSITAEQVPRCARDR